AALEAAGIQCVVEPATAEIVELYEAHARYITTGIPFVVAKFAMSLDGKIATASGASRWITAPEARRRANELRRLYDAVAVGVGTVLADDPRLTARDEQDRPLERQPLRVVVDSRGRTPPEAALFGEPGETLVALAAPQKGRIAELRKAGAQVLEVPAEDGRVDLPDLLKVLALREVTSLLVEGGGKLLGSFFDLGLVDKVVAFIAPVVIGGAQASSPVEGKGVARLADAFRLRRVKVERAGDDIVVVGYPSREA
ncbi:MAG: bifunctional diaminohydroxyphosphoribosylaminopyrimidine deaminase/5-amino-6-(5-phosphoribosylamino)uracil reductase RibD, partial [Chloroflexota bacterium]|nr:bifunctional diaminohydroxyphosphoribosylaminopyrimidine deaminase/5-amino-6-(5-phosphoribosylamino)uracil reductase RibD [Chloroflexota bacterium]